VRERFPNRYTGGYNSSTVTDKLRWQTISSVKKSRLNGNSDMGGESVIARKAYPCCLPVPVPPVNPCDAVLPYAFHSINAIPNYSCSDANGRCIIVGFWQTDPLTVKNSTGSVVSTLSGGSGSSGFVSVFGVDGILAWSAKIVGTNVRISQVITDSVGNITCTGFYIDPMMGSLTAYSADGLSTITPANNGPVNIFLVQYGPNGTLNWCANIVFQSVAANSDINSIDMALGANDSILLFSVATTSTFQFYDSGGFASGLAHTVSGEWALIHNINSDGSFGWNSNITSVFTHAANIYYDGNTIMVSGHVQDNKISIMDPAGTTTSMTYTTTAGFLNTYIASFTLTGYPVWRTAIANTSNGNNYPGSISLAARYVRSVVSALGNTFHIGTLDAGFPINFYDSDGITRLSLTFTFAVNPPSYIASIDSSGFYSWVAKVDGIFVRLNCIRVIQDSLYICGTTSGNTLVFYNSDQSSAISIPGNCGFVAKYDQNGFVQWVRSFDIVRLSSTLTCISDGADGIFVYFAAMGTFNFYDAAGATIKTLGLSGGNNQVLAKYSLSGDLEWASNIGDCTDSLTTWITNSACNEVVTLGSAWIGGMPCSVYDASGSILFSFPDQSRYSAVITRWI